MALSSVAFLLTCVSSVIAFGLAAFVLRCNRRAPVNRWLALGLLVIAFHQALVLTSRLVLSEFGQIALLRAAFGVLAAIPPIWLGFGLAFGEKDGSPRRSPWYPILPCMALVAFGTVVPLVFGRGLHLVSTGETGYLLVGLDGWGKVLFSAYLIGFVFVLVHVENLYRSAGPPERHRLRVLILGIFVAGACQIVTASHTLLFSWIHPSAPLLSTAGFLGGHVLIAFALVRHRLLDSNIYVSRYVVYRSLTLVLVGGYLLALGVTAELLPRLNISLDFLTASLFTIAAGVALAFLLLSENTRWRVKTFIQAHFYRHKYDYREEWMVLTRHLSRATTASEVAARTAQRILKVMWVQQVAIYATGDQPGSMHLLHQNGYPHLPSTLALAPDALRILADAAARLPSVGRMEDRPAGENDGLRSFFPEVSVGYIAPLVALDAPVGLLVVGPEMSGKAFGVDDKDLLAAVASQAGTLIANARFTQQAAEGRELQILARLSAFVAHDLKNSIGMLSLLAENAPNNIHKPEFQADAIRTLTEATGRMQRLLSALRTRNPEPGPRAMRANLAKIVGTSLSHLKSQVPPRIILETRLAPTPEIVMDPEQLRSVLVNLLMNAIDSIPGEGRITVSTENDHGWAVFSVTDTGQGMSGPFVRDRLFRPFQTTKPRGLGIGLFQCRHIVQGSGGAITVESQEGVGTRMVVALPVAVHSQIEDQTPRGSRPVDNEQRTSNPGVGAVYGTPEPRDHRTVPLQNGSKVIPPTLSMRQTQQVETTTLGRPPGTDSEGIA